MWEPFGRAPDDNTAYWKEGPNGRGSFSILSTCLITLSLCVYTSLHLNIPEHNKTYWSHQFWKRAWWVFLGVATPEFIAFVAIRDWLFARNFESDMKDALKEHTSPPSTFRRSVDPSDPEPGNNLEMAANESRDVTTVTQLAGRYVNTLARSSIETAHTGTEPAQGNCFWDMPTERKHFWTRTHSYFALMGGFAVDTSDMSINVLDKGRTRGTLTIPALKMLAEHTPMILPDLSRKGILDKSKANGLAKLLVCLQASWFCAQMVGRLATTGNPISLLELNTFLHAICCLATYGAWWQKPLDISEPELINVASKEGHLRFYARLCLGKPLHCAVAGLDSAAQKYKATLHRGITTDTTRNIPPYSDEKHNFAFASTDVTQELEEAMERLGPARYQIKLRLYDQQSCFGFSLKVLPPPAAHKIYAELKWTDVECLRLANDSLVRAQNKSTEPGWTGTSALDNLFIDHASMIDSPDDTLKRLKSSSKTAIDKKQYEKVFGKYDQVFWFSLMMAGAIYGGIHLLAWDGPFHTKREQWIWRISCMIIASPLIMVPFFIAIAYLIARTVYDELAEKITLGLLITTAIAFFLAYSAARVYLVVECFINFSHLPPEVYNEPAWSRYIPHFTAG